jgi:hypothetical protein
LFNFADAQMDIKDSWFSFINDGTVTKDAIRPEILRSWQIPGTGRRPGEPGHIPADSHGAVALCGHSPVFVHYL